MVLPLVEVLEERGSVLANDARADEAVFFCLSSTDGTLFQFCRPSPTPATAAVASRRRMEVEGQQGAVEEEGAVTFCLVVAIVSTA